MKNNLQKLLQDNIAYLVWFIFAATVYWVKSDNNTKQIIDAMQTKWPITAQQMWSDRLHANNPQMVVPSVQQALDDSNIRIRSAN